MQKEEFKKYFNRRVYDEEVKKIIFNNDFDDDFFLDDTTPMLHYFNNLMILAFVFIYGKYRIWAEKIQNESEIKGNRFLRVLHTLGKIYEKNNLSYDIIESLLMNIQIEGENAQIKKSFGLSKAFDSNKKLSLFTNLAKKYRDSAFICEVDTIEERVLQLKEFIDGFRFLQDIDIKKIKISNMFEKNTENELVELATIHKINFVYLDEEIDTKHILIEVKKQYYYLEGFSEESGTSNYIILHYRSLSNMNRGLNLIVANDVLKSKPSCEGYFLIESGAINQIKIDLDLVVKYEDKDDFIRDFYTINYKYIRNLVLATTDILEHATETAIRNRYGSEEKYKKLFNNRISIPKVQFGSEVSSGEQLSWDAILAILFIEEGASNILELIFKTSPNDFKNLLQNLEVRFGKTEEWSDTMVERSRIKAESSFNEWQKLALGSMKEDFGSQKALTEQQRALDAELKAVHIIEILKEISSVVEESSKDRSIPISINSIISLVKDIRDSSSKSVKDKALILKEIVAQTLKTLYLFYIGFFEYSKKKLQFERESYQHSFSLDEVTQYQEEANTQFEIKVSKELNTLNKEIFLSKDYGIIILLDKIQELVYSCQNRLNGKSLHNLLKYSLGRNQLLDFDQLEGLKYCFGNPIETQNDFEEISTYIIDKFEYLRTGESKQNLTRVGPIFPYVATYEYYNQTKDGYDVGVFSIVGSNNNTVYVKVLSEFIYKLNDKYLVLPNQARTSHTQGIWIEPTIINSRRFIKYFENAAILNEINFEFSQLSQPKHYEQTAKLIYQTDPYIYHDLFGSMENALKVLPILFEDPKTIFYKNNFYVVLSDNKISGVGGFFSKKVKWDKNHFHRVFLENNLVLPESFNSVSQYYEKIFNLFEDSRNVCNICVHKEEQRKGIASFLIKRFIEMAGNEDIHLTVLSENIPAIKLYEKHGFKITHEFHDYGGHQQDLVPCVEMRYLRGQH